MDLKERIIVTAAKMLMEMGVSSTTMDGIARACGISKRTLYEHFPDKLTLMTQSLRYQRDEQNKALEEIFTSAPNQFEALMRVYTVIRKQVTFTSIALIRDIQRLYPTLYAEYEAIHDENNEAMTQILRECRQMGMVRPDANIKISVSLFGIAIKSPELTQMAYKNDIPLVHVLDTLFINFLRSIASPEGMKVVDDFINDITSENNKTINN